MPEHAEAAPHEPLLHDLICPTLLLLFVHDETPFRHSPQVVVLPHELLLGHATVLGFPLLQEVSCPIPLELLLHEVTVLLHVPHVVEFLHE